MDLSVISRLPHRKSPFDLHDFFRDACFSSRLGLHRHEILERVHLLAYRVNRPAGVRPRCSHRLRVNLEDRLVGVF